MHAGELLQGMYGAFSEKENVPTVERS